MRTRTWFLLSLMLFVAAAVCWQLGEARRKAEAKPLAPSPVQKQNAVEHRAKPMAAQATAAVAAVPAVRASVAAPAGVPHKSTLPEDKKYPYRLRNTTKSVDQLARSDAGLLLRNALMDTSDASALVVPEHLRATGDAGSYIVQARGPIDKAFRENLRSAGAEVIAYVPQNAYWVRVSAQGAGQLAATPGVSSVVPFEPYFKLADPLLELAVEQQPIPENKLLNVVTMPGTSVAGRQELERLGNKVVGEQRTPFGPEFIVQPKPEGLVALAQSPLVQNIEMFSKRRMLTDFARETMGISGQTNGPNNLNNLSGTNVVVAVVDSGVDATHPDLSPRVYQTPNPPFQGVDTNGHGTAVAGVIGGSGQNTGGLTNVSGSLTNASYRGMAPQCTMLPIPIGIDIFGVGIFFGIQTDQQIQETIARSNVFIANNSWGYLTPVYDTAAASYDAAVRDSNPYRTNYIANPVVYVFAAGNDGFGSSSGVNAIADTIVSPATAKNVITVSALEQARNITNTFTITNTFQITDTNGNLITITNFTTLDVQADTDSSDQVASYSSRGNVSQGLEGKFGRMKPDVVAPGSFLVVPATQSPPGWGNSYMTNPNPLVALLDTNIYPGKPELYRYESGTSLAAGAVSGLLALMQEFFEQHLGVTNSPAMMKALLINGARTLGNSGYDFCVTNTITDQGWGLPTLTNCIPPALTNGLANSNSFPIIMIDQSAANALATGESKTWQLQIVPSAPGTQFDPTNFPLRVTLVWTDPPGNPNVAIKLVNDLDLIVFDTANTNYYFGNNIPQFSEFTAPMTPVDVFGTNVPMTGGQIGPLPPFVPYTISNNVVTNLPIDFVNNVENVFIDAPVSTNYLITVFARRVNVNAVPENTNNVVQDFALVISSANTTLTNVFVLSTPTNSFTNRVTTPLVNGVPLQHERVGANFQLLNPTNGVGNQWNFYVFTNSTIPDVLVTNTVIDQTTGQPTNIVTTNSSMAVGTNVAFIIYRPVNLARPRVREADIDMFVSKDPNFNVTNLLYNPALFSSIINDTNITVRSVGRGGSEFILLTNGVTPAFTPVSTGDVFYAAVKSEDQQASDYNIVVISTDSFASTNAGGVLVKAFPLPQTIPDGSPDSPQGIELFAVNPYPMTLQRVVVTNFVVTHEDLGDLVGVLNHGSTDVMLFNHSLLNGTNNVTSLNLMYDDRTPVNRPDGPGTLADFTGVDASGVWLFTVYDNSPFHTGMVENAQLQLFKQTNSTSGNNILLNGGESYIGLFYVPPFATNMVVDISYNSGNGPLDVYLRLNALPPPFTGIFDMFARIFPPFGSLTNDIYGSYTNSTLLSSNVSALASGFYFITINNADLNNPVDFNFNITFGLSLAALDTVTLSPNTVNITIPDNATTNSIITVSDLRVITDVTVGINAVHPQISDLTFRLTSPSGTTVLLFENRGGVANGISVSNLNVNFTENTNLVTAGYPYLLPIKFAPPPYTNIFAPPQLETVKFFGGIGDQSALGAAIFANAIFISGITDTNAVDGLAVRFDLPVSATNGPVWLTNWPGDLNRTVLWFFDTNNVVQIAGQTTLSNAATFEAVVYLPSANSASGFTVPLNPFTTPNFAGYLFTEYQFAQKDMQLGGGPAGLVAQLYDTRTGLGAFYSTNQLSLDQWHHIAFVYDGVEERLYLDGNLATNSPVAGTTLYTSPAPGYLGAMLRSPGTTLFTSFLGYVDSLRISSNVRYTGTGFTPPLGDMTSDTNTALLYNFNQPTGSAFVPDVSGNGRQGILGLGNFGPPTYSAPTAPVFTNFARGLFGTTGADVFNAVTVTDEGVYMAGQSKSMATNASGVYTNKGMLVKYPYGGVNGVFGGSTNGCIWFSQVPPGGTNGAPFGFDGESAYNAVTFQKEFGTNYIYVTGTAQATNGNAGQFFISKIDTTGSNVWTRTGPFGTTIDTNYSAGNAIAVESGNSGVPLNIWVAGVTNYGILGDFPVLYQYDPQGNLLFTTTSPTPGTFNGMAISGGFIYAVGTVNNGQRKQDWLMEKWRIVGNNAILVWSQVIDGVAGAGPAIVGASDDDVLYGVTVLGGTHVYATGYTVDAGTTNAQDLVLLEIDDATGNILSTSKYGGAGTDIGRAIVNDGNDLYVVGQAAAAQPIPRSANGSAAPDFFSFDTASTSGTLTIDYDFFGVPDSMHVYYEGNLIFDSGFINGAGQFVIPFGPGTSTVVTIVMNETGGQVNTLWTYTISSSGSAVNGEDAILLRYRVKNAYLPEEPLSLFNGESSLGDWTLTVEDTRLGPDDPNNARPQFLANWELKLTYAPTNLFPLIVFPGIPIRFLLSGSDVQYLQVNAPAAASIATNSITADRNVQLVFNADRVPVPGAVGNFTLLPGTKNGVSILTTNGTPAFKPGSHYYMAVQNVSATGPPNNVEFTLGFDQLYTINPLTSGTTINSIVASPGEMAYYLFNVSPNSSAATFELTSLSGNADLYLRKGGTGAPLVPDTIHFDYRSMNPGIRADRIFVVTNAGVVPLASGPWYVGVRNSTFNSAVSYSLRTTEISGPPFNELTLTSGTPLTGSTDPGNAPKNVYRFNVPSGTNAVLFEIVNISGADGNLVLRHGSYPSSSVFDLGSFNGGYLPDRIALRTNSVPGVSNISGNWYLGVLNNQPYSVDYTLRAAYPTNGMLISSAPLVISPAPVFNPVQHSIGFDWNTLNGEKYQVQFSTNLINWTVLTNIVAPPGGINYIDTGVSTNARGFYRIIQVP